MNHPRLPRALIILLFILLAGTFLVGTLRSFASARAATVSEAASLDSRRPGEALAPTLTSATLEATFTGLPALFLPPPTEVATLAPTPLPTFIPTNTPLPEPAYISDMTGIVSLGILLVVVILVGVTWGGRGAAKKKVQK